MFHALQNIIYELQSKDNANYALDEPHMCVAFTISSAYAQFTLPTVSVTCRMQFARALQQLYDLMCELC